MRTLTAAVLAAALPLALAGCGSSDDEPTAKPPTAAEQKLIDAAEQEYAAFVAEEADALLAGTEEFARLYAAGQDDRARAAYPEARTHWERIETVAESFGDLDPQLDAREADLGEGEEWTGWHRIEKDLWPERAEDYVPLTDSERTDYTDELVADTEELVGRIGELEFTIGDIADGSRGLLEEVANGKVTGEEEYWSRTDLYDFQANIDGAVVGVEGIDPLLEERDPELAQELETRFDEIQALLDQHRDGDGFVSYDDLSDEEVKELADAVNAVSEPLSRLSAAVA